MKIETLIEIEKLVMHNSKQIALFPSSTITVSEANLGYPFGLSFQRYMKPHSFPKIKPLRGLFLLINKNAGSA